MISAIVAVGILFSILTYQSYIRNSSDVHHIAVEHIQNTTLVKVSDLTQILKNKLDLVTVNLEMLSSSREILEQRLELSKTLMNSVQKTTTNFVDFYSWIDSNGTRIWSSSNMNDTSGEKIKEFSNAAQKYFENVKDTQVPSYSNAIRLTDGQSGILFSYPIIDTQNRIGSQNNTNEFRGVVLAGISSETLNNFLQSQLPTLISANISLVDSSGMMILTGIPGFMGTSVFDKRFDSMVGRSSSDDIHEKNVINVIRKAVSSPGVGTADISIDGKEFTVSFAPVMSNGIHFLL